MASSFFRPVCSQDTLFIDTVAVKCGRTGGVPNRLTHRIDARQISTMAVQSPDDYLDYIPWVDLRSRGIQGIQGDLSIRGAGYEQTLILMDGVPISDAQTGHHNLNLPIPVEMISGMEIIASGASRIFGPKAMAGSVNFTLKAPRQNRVWASAFGGDYSMYRLAAGVSGFKNGFGIGLSAQTTGSAGYTQNTDFKNDMVLLQALKLTRYGKIWLNFSGGGKRFGAQNFYSSVFPRQHEYTKTGILTLNWEHNVKNWAFSANAFARYNQDRFELFREGQDWYRRIGNRYIMKQDTAPAWYGGHNYHRSLQSGAMLNASRKMGIHTLSIGSEIRLEYIQSNVLGEPLSKPDKVPFGDSNAFFSRGASRTNGSVFIEDKIQYKKWIISAGLLVNSNSDFGTDIYPGLDLAYGLSSKIKLFASANRSNRFPTYTDLYYNRGGAVGSKNLKPEESVSGELGTEMRFKRVFARFSAFARNNSRLIDWVRLPGSTTTTATNLTEVLYHGADAQLVFRPGGKFKKWLTELGLGIFGMGANNNSDGFESNYALDFIDQKATVHVELKPLPFLKVGIVGYHQRRRGGFIRPRSTVEEPFDPIQSADIRITASKKAFSFIVEARNVFNARVMDFGNIMLPGRWLNVGLKFDLQDFK